MAAQFYDPSMLEALMANMPETRRRQRRAKKLRKSEERLQQMAERDISLGSVSKGTDGGLYQTQGAYIPNYSGMAEKAIGGIGQILAGREADEAEEEFDAMRAEGLIGGAEVLGQRRKARMNPVADQLAGTLGVPTPPMGTPPIAPQPQSGPAPLEQEFPDVNVESMLRGQLGLPGQEAAPPAPEQQAEVPPEIAAEDQAAKLQVAQQETGGDPEAGPTDEAIRMYMALLDAPNVEGILGDTGENFTISTKEDSQGNVWLIKKHGPPVMAGFQANYNAKPIQDPATGKWYSIGSSGAGRSVAQPVIPGAAPLQPGQQYIEVAPPQPGQQPGQAPSANDPESWYRAVETAESTGNQGAVSPVGARGVMQLMPPTAREMEAKLGLPPGSTDTDENANRMAGRAYLDERMKARNGDRRLALMDYNWGMGNVDNWIASGADPSQVPPETSAYVDKVTRLATGGAMGGQTNVGLPATAAGTIPPAPGGIPAAPQGAGQTFGTTSEIDLAGAKQTATDMATAQVKAKEALSKAEGHATAGVRAIDDLLSNPEQLKAIVGDPNKLITYGSIPDALADFAVPLFSQGKPAAAGYAKWKTVQGAAFLAAFEELRGGGQITEAEGNKATVAKAALSRAQSYEEVREALMVLRDVVNAGLARARSRASGNFSGEGAAIPSAPGLPAPPAARPELPPGYSWED